MLTIISPAKTLDYESNRLTDEYSQPQFISDSATLIKDCKNLTANEIASLMSISPKLSELNFERFQNWSSNFSLANARQAILAFKGDVYEGLNVEDFNTKDYAFAQSHLRILSGLYGLLRPLDLIQPYRLEMGIRLKNGTNNNLYQFWDDKITEALNEQLAAQAESSKSENTLINLASNEYFKVIKPKKLHANIIQPIFLDESKGKFKVISFYAKKARGLMSRFICKNKIDKSEDLKAFDVEGYQFDKATSTDTEWIFKRHHK